MSQLTTIQLSDACTAILFAIGVVATEQSLRAGLPLTDLELADLAAIRHPAQRLEWLGCRVAIQQLIQAQGVPYAGLWKDEYGKPHPIGLDWHISLSHTSGWASAVLHRSKPVGIDIEPIRDQFRRVVPRVLSEAEIAHAAGMPQRLAVYWCAKEALYKLYGKRQLTFREHLMVEPFADEDELLTGHVVLPQSHAQPGHASVSIRCFRTGPGLLAVAY
jgi:phosphopantetheinyl transferase